MEPGHRMQRGQAAAFAFFFKRWGAHDVTGRRRGKKAAGRLLDGRKWDDYPAASVRSREDVVPSEVRLPKHPAHDRLGGPDLARRDQVVEQRPYGEGIDMDALRRPRRGLRVAREVRLEEG